MNSASLPNPRASKGTTKGILLGLIILAAGIVIGVSLTILFPSLLRQDKCDPEPELFAEQTLRQLDRQLDLTPEQRQQLEPLLQAHYRDLQEIRAEVRPRIVAQLEELDQDITALLDERQELIWQQQVQRLEDHFPSFRGRGRRAGQGRGARDSDQRGPRGPQEPLGPGYRRNNTSPEPHSNEKPTPTMP